MLLEVLGDQGLQQGTAGAVERPAIHQDLGQGPGLVGDPGGEGGQQVVAADEVVLQGQDAEEEVAAGVHPRSRRPARPPGPGAAPKAARTTAACPGEPVQVLLGRRAARRAAPQLALQRHQLAQQRRAVRLVGLGQVVLDPRRWPRPPGGLEPVARLVDPLRRPRWAVSRSSSAWTRPS